MKIKILKHNIVINSRQQDTLIESVGNVYLHPEYTFAVDDSETVALFQIL